MTAEAATMLQLQTTLAGFRNDPLGHAQWSYPWNKPGSQLANRNLRGWQKDVLTTIGDHMTDIDTRYQPCMISVASGHGIGKAQPYSLELDTPDGVRRWEDIQPGSRLFGSDGAPVSVVARHEQGERDIYRVAFSDGTSTLADAEHLWSVKGRKERRNNREWVQLTTAEIVERGVCRPNGSAQARQWEIPGYKPVEYPAAEQPINPYVLGIWLGDGTKSTGSVTTPDAEIWGFLTSAGYELGKNLYKGSGAEARALKGLVTQLKRAGIYGCTAENCRVPEAYRYADKYQRLAILQGLLDSDGWVEASGTVAFGSISVALTRDVVWLARSLGMVARDNGARKKYYRDKNGHKIPGKPFHTATITWDGDSRIFRLRRKFELLRKPQARYRKRWISSIEYSHRERAMCVTVDAPDSLYLTNDFIVTHNSSLIAMVIRWALDCYPGARCNVTANTEAQLRTKTVPEVMKWQNMAVTSSLFQCTATSIYSRATGMEKSWRADFIPWSKTNPEAFAGLHNEGKLILIVMDEGSAIDDKIWEVTEGALTDENTRIIWLVFGNPTRNVGRFRECFRKHSKYWYRFQIDSRTVEGTNKKLFERWAEQYGEDSDFFKVRVRGIFPSMSARQLFNVEDIDRSYGKHLREEQYSFAPKILACDPAWEGDDELVIALRQGLKFEVLKRLPKNSNDVEIANLIARYEDELEVDAVNIDGGYGTGIVSAGRTMGRRWNLVWFSGKSSREDCVNKRAEMYLNVRDLLQQGLALPEIPDLYEEMIACELLPMLDGKYKLPPKEDTKEVIGRSPNLLDCLALTTATPVATGARREANRIKRQEARRHNPIVDRLKRS